jgi:hypothetical protein
MNTNFATSLLMISEIEQTAKFSYEDKEHKLLTFKGYFSTAKQKLEQMHKLKIEN